MITCIVAHIQWRWALNDRLEPRASGACVKVAVSGQVAEVVAAQAGDRAPHPRIVQQRAQERALVVAVGGGVIKCPPSSTGTCSITAMIVYISEHVPMHLMTLLFEYRTWSGKGTMQLRRLAMGRGKVESFRRHLVYFVRRITNEIY
jgi:hypothetical protein